MPPCELRWIALMDGNHPIRLLTQRISAKLPHRNKTCQLDSSNNGNNRVSKPVPMCTSLRVYSTGTFQYRYKISATANKSNKLLDRIYN